jgi:hypothetical protein
MYQFIIAACAVEKSRLNRLDYQSWVVRQIRACRCLGNWAAVEFLQGALIDATLAMYE